MVKKNRIPYFLFILVFVSSCAHKTRNDQNSIRELFEKKEYDKSLKFLESSSLAKNKKNRLLFLMEKGVLHFNTEEYKKAADIFIKANELVDKLYTKSVREKLASSILNDNSNTFYGSIFERSMLYYYQAMSFHNLYQKGFYTALDEKKQEVKTVLNDNEKKRLLSQVRNTLIAWNSFNQEMKRMKKMKSFLKFDLINKIVAATLHERLNTKRDVEISLQLYKDGYDILKLIGPAYKVFNNNFKEYNKNLREAFDTKKSPAKISKDVTPEYTDTEGYLKFKILELTKRIRKSKYKKELKKLKPSKTILKKLSSKRSSNLIVLLEEGVVNQLKGKDYSLNLRTAIDGIESENTKALINGIGVPVLTYFAMGPLGLGFASHHDNVTIYSTHNVGTTALKEVGVEFELPFVAEEKKVSPIFINIYKDKKLISKEKLRVVAPISGMSYVNSQEMIANSFKARSVKIGIKYLIAIAAAFKTYDTVKSTSGELFAKPAALGQFLLSQKAIKESESADIRHWSLIPSNILTTSLYLPSGSYDIEIIEKGEAEKPDRLLLTEQIKIDKNTKTMFSPKVF